MIISIIPFFLSKNNANVYQGPKDELYNPKLVKIDDINKAYDYVDSVYNSTNIGALDTQKYVGVANQFIKERFSHGLSSYSAGENWIAYLLGKYTWSHFSAIVQPNDILKYPYGLCSQQTLVFIDILKHKGIRNRTVGLGYPQGPGHFLCEVSNNNKWHLYDVTMEPKWNYLKNRNESLEYYLNNRDSIYLVYEDKLDRKCINTLFEKVKYGEVNELPAKKMRLFHSATYILTYLIPFFFLFLLTRSLLKIKRTS